MSVQILQYADPQTSGSKELCCILEGALRKRWARQYQLKPGPTTHTSKVVKYPDAPSAENSTDMVVTKLFPASVQWKTI